MADFVDIISGSGVASRTEFNKIWVIFEPECGLTNISTPLNVRESSKGFPKVVLGRRGIPDNQQPSFFAGLTD